MDQERTVDDELPTSPLPTTDTADDTDEVQFAGATPQTPTGEDEDEEPAHGEL